MRVAALSPQFVHETPEDLAADASRVIAAAAVRDRHDVRETTEDEASADILDERGRRGLSRLSRLILENTNQRDSQNESGDRDGHEERGDASSATAVSAAPGGPAPSKTKVIYMTKTERALETYRYAIEAGKSDEVLGQFIKLII